jgi:hypothetical protein
MKNIDEEAIRLRYESVRDKLDERSRRMVLASEVRAVGFGGVAAVSRATGVARSTLGRALKDLDDPPELPANRARRKGGGRASFAKTRPDMVEKLREIVEPATLGDPMRPLLWVSKSCEKLAAALKDAGYQVCANTVHKILPTLGFSRQVNRKTREGVDHPNRDAQFEYINKIALTFQAQSEPIISVDTKKKELIGDFKNGGSDYRPKGCPDKVRTHDFIDKQLGKAIPYGVYDVGANAGWVSVGIDHDTAEFAVNTIETWWERVGRQRYPNSKRLMITADGGGSNGSRVKLWKLELQRFADASGLEIVVCHYPPGASKWNKIEHRLFCQITQNWRGKPLTSRMVVVDLIGATTTTTGLTVQSILDEQVYTKGITVTEQQMAEINIVISEFCPAWNYTIIPRGNSKT